MYMNDFLNDYKSKINDNKRTLWFVLDEQHDIADNFIV